MNAEPTVWEFHQLDWSLRLWLTHALLTRVATERDWPAPTARQLEDVLTEFNANRGRFYRSHLDAKTVLIVIYARTLGIDAWPYSWAGPPAPAPVAATPVAAPCVDLTPPVVRSRRLMR